MSYKNPKGRQTERHGCVKRVLRGHLTKIFKLTENGRFKRIDFDGFEIKVV